MKSIALFTFTITLFLYSCTGGDKKATGSIAPVGNEEVMEIKSDSVSYSDSTVEMVGYFAVDTATKDKKPIVLIVPEWWGLGDYVKTRALDLAKLGYFAMVVDMYGKGTYVEDPKAAQGLATPFYQNPQMAKSRFDAALAIAKQNPLADTNRIAAIGYCFGGAQVLNMARMGENLNGVVSFHGDLVGVTPEKNKIMAHILVCHGAEDKFVDSNQVNTFKKQMDSVGAVYTFKVYPGATHAFTNPDASRLGKKFQMPIEYNAAADTASWNEMKTFFKEIF